MAATPNHRAGPVDPVAAPQAARTRPRSLRGHGEAYTVDWLLPQHAPELAALEARIHDPAHRAGEALIAAQLETTEWGGRNLSLGLYVPGGRLVGFVLAFSMRDRAEVAEFFDAPVPAALDPSQPTLYIADWAVEPAHRGAVLRMAERFIAIVRGDEQLARRPLAAFGTPEYADKWAALKRFAAAAGWRLAGRHAYHDTKLGRQMFWLDYEPVAAPAPARPAPNARPAPLTCRVVTDMRRWADLKLVWDQLLESSPESTPWQSYAFLTLWWRHLSKDARLRIFVVERAGVPRLVLPMQISRWRGLGLPVRILEPIGMLMDVNRPRLALGEVDPAAYRCALDAIWQHGREWDVLRVDEKPWDDAEIALLRDAARARSAVFRHVYSHAVPSVDLRRPWAELLRTRSAKLRKNLRAARRRLERRGAVTLEVYEAEADVERAFEYLVELHERSWKRARTVEYSRSAGYANFFGGWVYHMTAMGRCRILVLFCGETPVAATAAFIDGNVYYSAQIVHDARFADCSPGTLLEAMELERLLDEGRFATYDMLGSFLNNKMRWATSVTETWQALVFQRRLRAFLMDAYFFTIKPYVRPALLPLLKKLRLARG